MADRKTPPDIAGLTADLCRFATGVVAPENVPFFERLRRELPFKLHRYASGAEYNGWLVPDCWSVRQAMIEKDGAKVFDGTNEPVAVAAYSKSFEGSLDWEQLKPHLVTNPKLPDAFVYHCMWQYRPWDADWAISVPHNIFKTFGPGRYTVRLKTIRTPGQMIVADYEHKGQSDKTIVLNAHTCHPRMANDDFAGVALLVRLMQSLKGRRTQYTYRLVLGPEHIGTVFYLHGLKPAELKRLACGIFVDMPATDGPIKLASTFLGAQVVDAAIANAARHGSQNVQLVPWRKGAGNDETVWEAPGYEVPFVEVTRCIDMFNPYPQYHTNLDTPKSMNLPNLNELYSVLADFVDIVENNSIPRRTFDGLLCLSNPKYNLYFERPDPAVSKDLPGDSEKWGYLLDSLLRYLDGSITVLEIADRHDLPFRAVYDYLLKFQAKGLVKMDFSPMTRPAISKKVGG
ncbi:MAG: DUF4910 domain-containing protein [Planctomycetes bacterium]|nr:DUF4910 domain-containing protein [Planctomycetota bacterium]